MACKKPDRDQLDGTLFQKMFRKYVNTEQSHYIAA